MGGWRSTFRLLLAGLMWLFVLLRLSGQVGSERANETVNLQ
jgi:hypothetical protein